MRFLVLLFMFYVSMYRSWIDIWDLLSQECREEVVLVDADGLLNIGVDRLGFDYKRRKQDPSVLIVEEDFQVLQRFIRRRR